MPQVIILPNGDTIAENPSTTNDVNPPMPNSDYVHLPKQTSSGSNNLILIVVME